MFAKLNHLAITTDQYTVLGMFYRAYMGMKVSGVTEREQSAISVGDGYIGMTLIPRRPGRRGGQRHQEPQPDLQMRVPTLPHEFLQRRIRIFVVASLPPHSRRAR